MKILFTGGGTGGHILPIIGITRELKRVWTADRRYLQEEPELYYIGPRDKFGSILLSREGVKVKTILTGKIRRYLGFLPVIQNFIDILFKIPIGIFQAFLYIFFLTPDLIFSKGGYGSFPTVISGWILRVPIFLHESDISPGFTNRILSKFSLEIFVSFPKTEYFSPKKIILVGNPIRKEVLRGSLEEAKKLFNLIGKKPVMLILGGSQGAQRINDKILEVLPELLRNFEILHQCGERNFEQVKAESKVVLTKDLEKYYHPFPFFKEEELKQAYQAANIIISRAGSGSIFEIAAVRKPAILIPLPEAAQKHQIKNAYSYAEGGAAIVIEEANFTPHFFLEKLKYLVSQSKEIEKMKKAAKEFSKPRAAEIVAEYIIKYLD